jgi:hypothetical protein
MARKITTKKKASTKKPARKQDNVTKIVEHKWALEELEGIIHQVRSSKSSVFAKDDVLGLLSEVKKAFVNPEYSPDLDKESLINDITENICDNISVNDLDDFELELDGTSIGIDMIKLDEHKIREYVSDVITTYI